MSRLFFAIVFSIFVACTAALAQTSSVADSELADSTGYKGTVEDKKDVAREGHYMCRASSRVVVQEGSGFSNAARGSQIGARTVMLSGDCEPGKEAGEEFFRKRSWMLPIEKPRNPSSEWMTDDHEHYENFCFDCAPGTPVLAVADGIAQLDFIPNGRIRVVRIDHGRYLTVYNYLSKIEVSNGTKVIRGQRIGLSGAKRTNVVWCGNCGKNTDHLHLKIRPMMQHYPKYWFPYRRRTGEE